MKILLQALLNNMLLCQLPLYQYDLFEFSLLYFILQTNGHNLINNNGCTIYIVLT